MSRYYQLHAHSEVSSMKAMTVDQLDRGPQNQMSLMRKKVQAVREAEKMKLLDLPDYPAQDLPASALAAAATSSSIQVNYLAGLDLKLKDLQSSLALRALALRALALRALDLLPASMMATISHQLMIVPENRLRVLFQRRPTDLERK
jgi:hypothetical protein